MCLMPFRFTFSELEKLYIGLNILPAGIDIVDIEIL